MNSFSKFSIAISRSNHFFLLTLRIFISIVLLCMGVFMFLEAALRYTVHISPIGLEESVLFAASWLYMIGAGYATYERGHIRSDLIDTLVKSQSKKNVIAIGVTIFCILVCIGLGILSYEYLAFSIKMKTRLAALGWPWYYQVSSLVAGFALMLIYFFVELVDRIKKAIRKE